MKDECIFKIKENGAIEILGVNIGYDSSYVMTLLKLYGALENENCVYINSFTNNIFKSPATIFFSKKDEYISGFRIHYASNNKDSSLQIYNYLLDIFINNKLYINTIKYKVKEGKVELNHFSNDFIDASLFIQFGQSKIGGGEDINKTIVGMTIKSNIIKELKDDDFKNESVQIVLRKYLKSYWEKDHERARIPLITLKRCGRNIIKILVLIFVFIVLYLFSLNGRYKNIGDDLILDTWTKTTFDRSSVLENNIK